MRSLSAPAPQGDASDSSGVAFELAKSARPRSAVFTNCGKPERQDRPVKSAKKLTRVPFTVSRLTEFCTRRELVNQTGHDVYEWPLVVLKELTDNALDACEEAEIAPVISIAVKGRSIIITDNGPGIPAKTIDGIIDYNVRVSSREAYCGATIWMRTPRRSGWPFWRLRRGDDCRGATITQAIFS
jgi:hypothetical protein